MCVFTNLTSLSSPKKMEKKCSKCSNNDMTQRIASMLTDIIEENKDKDYLEEFQCQKKLAFFSLTPASLSIYKYMHRIMKYSHIEESTIILALIFIDRICEYNDLILSENNIHRILFAGILLAIKINEDDYYSNSYYSKVAGISLNELNKIEYEFILLINYKFFVFDDTFERYKIFLCKNIEN